MLLICLLTQAPTCLPGDLCVLTDLQPSPCQRTCCDGTSVMEGSSEPGSGGEEEPTLIPFLEEEGNGTAAQSSDPGEHEEGEHEKPQP